MKTEERKLLFVWITVLFDNKPHFDKNGYPQFMTDSKFEVFSASSDRGKECIQKFCAIWDASTNLF